MIKFVIRNEKLYTTLQAIPLVKKFFVFDISRLNHVEDYKLFDGIYSSISNPNGTSKTTSGDRFVELDKWLLESLPSRKLIVHDVAVSSGITSLVLFDQLAEQQKVSSFHISDKYAKINFKGSGIKRFYDAEGQCMFIHVFGLYAIKQTSWFFLLSKLLFILFNKTQTGQGKELCLFHPLVLKKLDSKQWVLEDYNVFISSHQDQFDLVRCMNLLNTLQFSEDQIKKAINHLNISLKDGGFLLLGRTTMGGEHRASLLKKNENRWQTLKELNGGSELKNLMDLI
jgi:hypothetical protein